jgi:Leucine-rich repeat (LRR) protein
MLQKLRVLNLRDNYLSRKLPPQLEDLKLLSVLDLANNNIYGDFPSSMQYLSSLRVVIEPKSIMSSLMQIMICLEKSLNA